LAKENDFVDIHGAIGTNGDSGLPICRIRVDQFMKELLEKLVEERGGTYDRKRFETPPIVQMKATVPLAEGEIRIDHHHRPAGDPENNHNEFIFRFLTRSELNWQVYLYPESWSDQVLKFLGSQDIQVGLPKLDPLFMIKSNQPDLLKSYLKNGPLCEYFEQVPQMEFRIRSENEQLQMEMRCVVNPPRPDHFDFLLKTFEVAIEQLWKIGV
jgi:hypothetical protein